MRIRQLERKDAPLMLEWMHDENVTSDLRADFSQKTLADAESFIQESLGNSRDIHLAIVSDEDTYMGTVSLKNIQNGCAEFGIAVRSIAMGKGYSWFGMEEIMKLAFDKLDLESVYWCVSRKNTRAVRFYDKHSFKEVLDVPEIALIRYRGVDNLKWYLVLKGDVLTSKSMVAGCRVIRIKTIPTMGAGELSFFEGEKDVPFEIRRIYYISKVPEGVKRGFHAHKELKQLLFCPYGRILLTLENRHGREEIELSDPSVGVLIEECTWREMLWLQEGSVLCVAASDFYCAEDYIRDYQEFKRCIQ